MPYLLTFLPFQTSLKWEFVNPEPPHHKFSATSKADLVRQIVGYRTQNELPEIENLNLVIDHYMCQDPVNIGKCKPTEPLKRGLKAFIRGGITLFKSLTYKSFTDQATADRRSDICANCPYNTHIGNKTRFIRHTDLIAEACIGQRKSSNHAKLYNCSICSCVMKAKVWMVPELIEFTQKELDEFPDFCWQKKEATVIPDTQ